MIDKQWRDWIVGAYVVCLSLLLLTWLWPVAGGIGFTVIGLAGVIAELRKLSKA